MIDRPTPSPFFVGGAQGAWGVDDIGYNARGKRSLLPAIPGNAPPKPGMVVFPAGGRVGPQFLQNLYTNVRTANNPCGPMAVTCSRGRCST